MKRATDIERKRERRLNDFPELQVGFPERNDVANPIDEMERIHVDLKTLNISRKNSQELTREIASPDSSKDKR
jgi:hypothetical protein